MYALCLRPYPSSGLRYGDPATIELAKSLNTRLLECAARLEAEGDVRAAGLLREATTEIDRMRRQRDDLISHLKGLSRQIAEMVHADSSGVGMTTNDIAERVSEARSPCFGFEALWACLVMHEAEFPRHKFADMRVSLAQLAQEQCLALRKALWGDSQCP